MPSFWKNEGIGKMLIFNFLINLIKILFPDNAGKMSFLHHAFGHTFVAWMEGNTKPSFQKLRSLRQPC